MTKAILEGAKCQWMTMNRIVRSKPFLNLFPPQPEKVDAIAEHIAAHGFDTSQPIIVWDTNGKNGRAPVTVVDGHTRFEAARKHGYMKMYVASVKFRDQRQALEYAIHNQRDRRNMDDAALTICIEAVDKRKRSGERTDLASSEARSGKSAEETAKIVGTSKSKVEKVRTIEKHADDETKEAVRSGRKSINKAYQEIQAKRKPKNREKASSIDKSKEHPSPEYKRIKIKYENFLADIVGFQLNNREKKQEWKEYLTNLHQWTSNLQAATQGWGEQVGLSDGEFSPHKPPTWDSLSTILADIALFLTKHPTPPDDLKNREDVVSAIKTQIQFLYKNLDKITYWKYP